MGAVVSATTESAAVAVAVWSALSVTVATSERVRGAPVTGKSKRYGGSVRLATVVPSTDKETAATAASSVALTVTTAWVPAVTDGGTTAKETSGDASACVWR